ncbi:ABC transporter substrate-binding protein [Acidisoma cellulosilytica]|uniref:ABC transporter substrate-binding protein n=1 Tax=Acidisoma cellulosilyticum TaxID=2802395 RepID=A0A963YYI1_9PROT|nr:ABC transporter substrate-binding protein [Acidisoma cellulosilyticum]MCB8879501.1 ABC transporter substrate-binding protein [Acidisoma cellulosilyticum]
MLRKLLLSACVLAIGMPIMGMPKAHADQKMTILLDWFVNPDHAPILAAEYSGAFKRHGLDVTIIAPADPSLPPRQIAAGQADLALTYQPQLYLMADEGLPVVRVGTLINKPLNVLASIDGSGIKTMADFKGKKIGYSVAGLDDSVVDTMLEHAGVSPKDVTLVNVNFALVTALTSHQVDGVIGAYRNFEVNELKDMGKTPVVFIPEDYGVPADDELVLIANKKEAHDPKIAAFLEAMQEGAAYLQAHPDEMWAAFIKQHPDLNNKLNKTAWYQTLPYFAKDPFTLDQKRYTDYEQFMLDHKLIKTKPALADYAIELKAP